MIKEEKGLLMVLSFENLAKRKNIRHFISTRLGGHSNSPYNSLNLGLHVGDNPDKVLKNRKRLAEAIGIPLDQFTIAKQIHSGTVTVISEAMKGRGSTNHEDAVEATDAMVTDVPGICLIILVADCVPMLFFDPARNVIAAAHAGWRGTLQSIALHTVRAMKKHFGCSPHDILVGMGPSIGPCCYEVGPEVIARVKAMFPSYQHCIRRESKDGKGYMNLQKANRDQLVRAGIRRENIETANQCTSHNAHIFFSYRHQHGETGRFGAGICMVRAFE
ncbi:MAG: peptidoglycan editing factor PgeF [Deltaproteobacteria bacterium]|nr:MAG: peptidoglycan editing factor PgeF [Deltaproteobacteria bacterium]